MATNKPASRNWSDIQMFLAAMAMALTLGLWNLFAGPDRVQALARQNAETALQPPTAEAAPVTLAPAAPTPIPQGKIILGGQAPQTQIFVNNPVGG
ncbi:MAG: hypothetical protein ACOY0R_00535, partial [Chloroflexota bacterium]